MKLRKLELRDAVPMLEWMHDPDVVQDLYTDFSKKTLKDCEDFIRESLDHEKNIHLAVADDADQYMGTVSLKHIDKELRMAEFGITVRACAMGRGFSHYAMQEMFKIGIEDLGIREIYWCVSRNNKRALRFYDKHQYQRVTDVPADIAENYDIQQRKEFIWYRFK